MKLSNGQLADIRPGMRVTITYEATYEELCKCSAVAYVEEHRYGIPEGATVTVVAPVPAQRGAWE